jgi:hypothetical protein
MEMSEELAKYITEPSVENATAFATPFTMVLLTTWSALSIIRNKLFLKKNKLFLLLYFTRGVGSERGEEWLRLMRATFLASYLYSEEAFAHAMEVPKLERARDPPLRPAKTSTTACNVRVAPLHLMIAVPSGKTA